MMYKLSFENVLQFSERTRWLVIVLLFAMVAAMDFSTPPEYVWAYLYAIPILISVSFLRSDVAKVLLVLAITATLLNLVWPRWVLDVPPVVVNRLLSTLSIMISAFFMLRYIQYQEQLREQEKLLETERNLAKVREDLIATLSHDLKTPLLGEQKTLQFFQEAIFGPLTDEQKDVLGVLRRSNDRQLSLVETLLSVYRNDNLGVEVAVQPINLDELIADLLTELQFLAQERGTALGYTCQHSPPLVAGEALQIKRVLSNLIHNALNYTPSGGRVEVRLSQQEKNALVEVSDTGPGLSRSDLNNVFYRFYQAGGDRQMIGTGLGLYLSRQIIQAHQGRIWAENLSQGGCRFSFTIPLTGGKTL